jgi:hypothetical protein
MLAKSTRQCAGGKLLERSFIVDVVETKWSRGADRYLFPLFVNQASEIALSKTVATLSPSLCSD